MQDFQPQVRSAFSAGVSIAAVAALLLLAPPTSAQAGRLFYGKLTATPSEASQQLQTIHPRDITKTLPPEQGRRLIDRLRLASYPDGGFIANINGAAGLPILRNGMRLTINGAGFAAQAPKSTVALFDGEKTTGATLIIREWSDARVVVDIPANQTALTNNTQHARLLLQGVKNGLLTRYELKNLRFVAGN